MLFHLRVTNDLNQIQVISPFDDCSKSYAFLYHRAHQLWALSENGANSISGLTPFTHFFLPQLEGMGMETVPWQKRDIGEQSRCRAPFFSSDEAASQQYRMGQQRKSKAPSAKPKLPALR